jgi:hypothetical protein
MHAVFVETTDFTVLVSEYLTEEGYAQLQLDLMQNPQCAAVLPGCGGLRKVRASDAGRGKGKRGGVRVIYLHVPASKRFLMLDIYGKGEQEDLSVAQKRILARLASEYRRQL